MKNKKKRIIISSFVIASIVLLAIYIIMTNFTRSENVTLRMAIMPIAWSHSTYYFVLEGNTLTVSYGTRRLEGISAGSFEWDEYGAWSGTKNEDIRSNRFMRFSIFRPLFSTHRVRLTDQELQGVLDLANELEASGFDELAPLSLGWGVKYVSLLYNDKVYEIHYWRAVYCLRYCGTGMACWYCGNEVIEIFVRLVDEIARLSPMPIDGGAIPHSPYQ